MWKRCSAFNLKLPSLSIFECACVCVCAFVWMIFTILHFRLFITLMLQFIFCFSSFCTLYLSFLFGCVVCVCVFFYLLFPFIYLIALHMQWVCVSQHQQYVVPLSDSSVFIFNIRLCVHFSNIYNWVYVIVHETDITIASELQLRSIWIYSS